ncbi:MAG: hypothetical protein ACI8VI_000951 [Granulosicoccus sp.]|jgi:hypothetical protein
MRILPRLFSLPIIALLAWVGSNIYQGNSLFANPFEDPTVLDDMKERGSDFLDDKVESATDAAKDSFNKSVENVSDALKDMTE